MDGAWLAWASLGALALVIVVSCTTRLNPGVLSIVLAALIGGWLAPMAGSPLSFKAVLGGFPSELFLTLTAVTLLFTQAEVNGTLERVAEAAVRCCRGRSVLVPVAFFVLAFVIASIGPGNIAATALLAPMAMAAAPRAGIPAFLMAVMVAHGALAGGMSPIAPTGVIAGGILEKQLGITGLGWTLYRDNLLANVTVSLAAYAVFAARRAAAARRADPAAAAPAEPPPAEPKAFEPRHWATVAVIGVLVLAVVFLKLPVAAGAFGAAALLTVLRLADDGEAMKRMPWGVMLMVCGVTVLTALLEKTGGSDLFTDLVRRISGERTVTGVIAFLTGLISVYSSTSGVVLPAFLPMVPGLAQKIPGADPVAIASSIVVGGHLVDSSSLSTLGALCVASAPPSENRRALFNRLLGWGMAMAAAGAVVCYVFFGLL